MTKNFRLEHLWPWLVSGGMLIPMIIDCWNGKWIHLHSHLLFFLGILSLVIFRLLKNETYAYLKAMGISIIYVFAYFMALFGGLPTYFKELSALIFGTSNALLLDSSTIFLVSFTFAVIESLVLCIFFNVSRIRAFSYLFITNILFSLVVFYLWRLISYFAKLS